MADPTGILPAVLLGAAAIESNKQAERSALSPVTARQQPMVDELGAPLDLAPVPGELVAPAEADRFRGVEIPLEPFTTGGVSGQTLLDEGNASINRVQSFPLALRPTTDADEEKDFRILRAPGNTIAVLWLDGDAMAYKPNERGACGDWVPLRSGESHRFDSIIKEWHVRLPQALTDYTPANGFSVAEPFALGIVLIGFNLDVSAVSQRVIPQCADPLAFGVDVPPGPPVPLFGTDCRRVKFSAQASGALGGTALAIGDASIAAPPLTVGLELTPGVGAPTEVEHDAGALWFAVAGAPGARVCGVQFRIQPPPVQFL